MRALARYQLFFLALLAATVLGALALTSWVNPWRVTPAPWSSDSLDEHREVENRWNRTAKAGLIRSGDWDAALFGSSRVDISLDPEHPAFDGMRCVNLGLNAAGIGENHAIFQYYIERHDPRLVVFCIDPGDLTSAHPQAPLGDFTISPLDPAADPLERELRYHAGVSALIDSGATVMRSLRDQAAVHTTHGFRRDAPFPDNQRALIASLYLSTTYRLAHRRMEFAHASTSGPLNPEKTALVDDIIRRCREKNARLVIFIPPNHALFQVAFRELGDPDPHFARDRRALAERVAAANTAAPDAPPVELWDFLDAHPFNSPPLPPAGDPAAHLPDWIDLFHSTSRLGNLMLDLLAADSETATPPYGILLTPDILDSRIADVAAGLDAYTRDHPEDIEFLRESLARFAND